MTGRDGGLNALVRRACPCDEAPVLELYPLAFPGEELRPLIRRLWADDVDMLVAEVSGSIAGHIAFSACRIDGADGQAALLGPLAVHPAHQRRGLGRALIDAGLAGLRDSGVLVCCVLGDPAYYGRYGFRAEAGLAPPYRLSEAWRPAWQSLTLGQDAVPEGKLTVPEAWRDPALWAP
ncbi:MAG: N-acetyltransferase [Pseudomonadota bacterium]